jgi:predicted AlkP superfamily pyrophosphatase or phosphodiesterase
VRGGYGTLSGQATLPMKRIGFLLLFVLASLNLSFASAYDGKPKLVVVIVIDQFRGDYLQRYHDEFGAGGFRLFTDRGAYFTDCYYDYATLVTGPGHATIGTGSYTIGHGIIGNEWYNPQLGKRVTSVSDDATHIVGVQGGVGSSPHNLLSDTFGDELRMATQGRSRVYGISLKDRAAILPTGYSANAAYWIDGNTGAWITSDYYLQSLPGWVQAVNESDEAKKFLNREWRDAHGKVMGNTNPRTDEDGKPESYFEIVGSTPFANDLELEFARSLITHEKLGSSATTDLLVVSLSENDILGHAVGPDSPVLHASIVELDRQLASFFQFVDKQIGLKNVWMALSADHGVAPVPREAARLHIPAAEIDGKEWKAKLNEEIAKTTGKSEDYVMSAGLPMLSLDAKAFGDMKEEDAERAAGEALLKTGALAYFTKSDLAKGVVPATPMGHKFANTYSPYGGWWVMVLPRPFTIPKEDGTTHFSPYSYDAHVPLAFYGAPFQPGVYRGHSEPIDLAVTLSSLLGTNKPAAATGRVLTEALRPAANPTDGTEHPHKVIVK